MGALIELSDVWKTYRQRQSAGSLQQSLASLLRPKVRTVDALAGVSLSISAGEIVAYAGPNGAGKSTTVKLLSGLLAPTAGTVRALGMDPVRDRARYVANIGVVFGQRSELWWDQPVAATFEWKRLVWNVPRERYDRMLALVTPLLGLDAFFQTLARELSLGQKMRADLALALMHEPEVLFLDEPTLGLDVLAKRNILACIKQLNRERGLTVMVTSHDMADLEELAGRIVLVHQGRIAFDGDWQRLRREFSDRRRLVLTTVGVEAPVLPEAQHVTSEANHHEYSYDGRTTSVAALIAAAAAQMEVLDVESQREDIDDVVADIYERWLAAAE